MSKPYLSANIDRAIVMTQFDLRGFLHPLGCRIEEKTPKALFYITHNLVAMSAGAGRKDDEGNPVRLTDPGYVSLRGANFDQCLAMCRRLCECCDLSQTEAIQLIIKEILGQARDFAEQKAAGKNDSPYILPLEPDNLWGKVALALVQAFEVSIQEKAPVPV